MARSPAQTVGDLEGEASLALIRQAFAASDAGDFEGYLSYFAEDVRFRVIGSTAVSASGQGRDAWRAAIMEIAALQEVPVALSVTNMIGAGPFVTVEALGHGVTKKGLDYDNTYCLIFEVCGGKIVRFTEYCDTELITKVLCA